MAKHKRNNYANKVFIIYAYSTPEHEGCLKIGETSYPIHMGKFEDSHPKVAEMARERIREQVGSAGVEYRLEVAMVAWKEAEDGVTSFHDHEVRDLLEKHGFKKMEFSNPDDPKQKPNEWMECTRDHVKAAIETLRGDREDMPAKTVSVQNNCGFNPRPEQREALDRTKKQFENGTKMLWDAKMRFGKTCTALQLIKEMGYMKTLIVTNRPSVKSGWRDDFEWIFSDSPHMLFGANNPAKGKREFDVETCIEKATTGRCGCVCFVSHQDLKGSKGMGGMYAKNSVLQNTKWDLLIVDESHEGNESDKAKKVRSTLQCDKYLALTGTSYKIIKDYKPDQVFSWTYEDEQESKERWAKENPYAGEMENPWGSLPVLETRTYKVPEMLGDMREWGTATFSLSEFFKTKTETDLFGERDVFENEEDVKRFLDLIAEDNEKSHYPFSGKDMREKLKHTLWVVGGQKEARALSSLLQAHPVFREPFFKVVNIAGEGDYDDPTRSEAAIDKVQKAVSENKRTITISCGRLLTGSTVPEWTGVLMLCGGESTEATTYMQTIFRVQSPWVEKDGNGKAIKILKHKCHVFDFAPERLLNVFAGVSKDRAERRMNPDSKMPAEPFSVEAKQLELKRMLHYMPVLSISGGKMERLEAKELTSKLSQMTSRRLIVSGFTSKKLFNYAKIREYLRDKNKRKQIFGIINKIPGTSGQKDSNKLDVNKNGFNRTRKKGGRSAEKKDEATQIRDIENRLAMLTARLPLLMYGADFEDNEFIMDRLVERSVVDEESWKEFMGPKVTREDFKTLYPLLQLDEINQAALNLRNECRKCDNMEMEERMFKVADIISNFRNPDKETVLTPWRVVNMHMGDTVGGYNFYDESYKKPQKNPRRIEHGLEDIFATDGKIMEVNSKTGLYPLYLAYNFYRGHLSEIEASGIRVRGEEKHTELWDKVLRENLFVLCRTEMARKVTMRTLRGFREGVKVNCIAPRWNKGTMDVVDMLKEEKITTALGNKYKGSFDQVVKDVKRAAWWREELKKTGVELPKTEEREMKFKAVVGNPPYQVENDGTSNGKSPIYHLFIDLGRKACPFGTLIHPARFLSRAGKTPKDWTERILADSHFKVVRFWRKSDQVFNNQDIKGGGGCYLMECA